MAEIRSQLPTDKYRSSWDRIFGKKKECDCEDCDGDCENCKDCKKEEQEEEENEL